MDVDTTALRSAGSTLTMVALGWTGAPATTAAVPRAPSAFGADPLAAELSRALPVFAERVQEAVLAAARRLDAAGEALLLAAARFERIEDELAGPPR